MGLEDRKTSLGDDKPIVFISSNATYCNEPIILTPFFLSVFKHYLAHSSASSADKPIIVVPIVPGDLLYALGVDAYQIACAPVSKDEIAKIKKSNSSFSFEILEPPPKNNASVSTIESANGITVFYYSKAGKPLKVSIQLHNPKAATQIAKEKCNTWVIETESTLTDAAAFAIGDEIVDWDVSLKRNYQTPATAPTSKQLILNIIPWENLVAAHGEAFLQRLALLIAFFIKHHETCLAESSSSGAHPSNKNYFSHNGLPRIDDDALKYMCDIFSIDFENFKALLSQQMVIAAEDDEKTKRRAAIIFEKMFQATAIFSQKDIAETVLKQVPEDIVKAHLEPYLYRCFLRNLLFMLFETTTFSFYPTIAYPKSHDIQVFIRQAIYAAFGLRTAFYNQLPEVEQAAHHSPTPSPPPSLGSSPPYNKEGQLSYRPKLSEQGHDSSSSDGQSSDHSDEALVLEKQFEKDLRKLISAAMKSPSNALTCLQLLNQIIKWLILVIERANNQATTDETVVWTNIASISEKISTDCPQVKALPAWQAIQHLATSDIRKRRHSLSVEFVSTTESKLLDINDQDAFLSEAQQARESFHAIEDSEETSALPFSVLPTLALMTACLHVKTSERSLTSQEKDLNRFKPS